MNKISVTYGKSMYGGWYTNYFNGGKYEGIHADTFVELKNILNELFGKNWRFLERYDN